MYKVPVQGLPDKLTEGVFTAIAMVSKESKMLTRWFIKRVVSNGQKSIIIYVKAVSQTSPYGNRLWKPRCSSPLTFRDNRAKAGSDEVASAQICSWCCKMRDLHFFDVEEVHSSTADFPQWVGVARFVSEQILYSLCLQCISFYFTYLSKTSLEV